MVAMFALMPPAAFLHAQEVASVTLSHKTVQVRVGQRVGVYATANDARGVVLVGQRFDWTSSDSRIVRVEIDPDQPDLAYVVGAGVGLAQVQVRAGSRSDAVAVQVTGGEAPAAPAAAGPPATVLRIEPGNVQLLPVETRALAVVFLRDDGSPGAASGLTWRSHNEAVATVTSDGRVVGQSEGRAVVEAQSATGLVATASVQVTGAAIGFFPPVLSLSPGGQAQAQVVVPTQGNRQVASGAMSWRSANDAVARVSPLGLVQAVGAGRTSVIAEGLGQSATLAVSVHRPVAEITMLPRTDRGPVTVPLHGSIPFTVEALDAQGQPIPEAPFAWTVQDSAIAAFDTATRRLQGRALGVTELRMVAPGEGRDAVWTVEVIAGWVQVTPERVGLSVRDTAALAATWTDESGRSFGPATDLVWRTTSATVATVTAAGTVTAVGTGHARVLAETSWNRSDTVDVFVQGRLVFTSTRAGSPDLYAVDPEAPGAVVRVTDAPGIETMGAYSPDGASIAYVSNAEGSFDIFVANADGSLPRRVTTSPGSETSPRWTPDGARLLFASQAPGGRAQQIWSIGADGADARALTDGDASNVEPAVSPDGRTVAFTSTRDGNYEIYLMAIDGSEPRNVTRSPLKESQPAWFPDGSLGYIQERGEGARITPVVVRHDLATGRLGTLSPPDLAVTAFAVSARGDLVALEVSTVGAGGRFERRLVLFAVDGGARAELPRQTPDEQLSSPSFRR